SAVANPTRRSPSQGEPERRIGVGDFRPLTNGGGKTLADQGLPAPDTLRGVLADVRRYLGWHRDVAGDGLRAAEQGALALAAPVPEVVVTVAGASEAPRVLAYEEAQDAGPPPIRPPPPMQPAAALSDVAPVQDPAERRTLDEVRRG